MDPFGYSFPAIRGVQAKREYFVSMCPLRLIPKIFSFDNEELPPEMRAQRNLNEARIPELKQYILDNAEDYVFSALTASIDSEVKFEPVGEGDAQRVGILRVPMDARFIINDGQHRRAAIEAALRENPSLGYETIAVVFFMDRGLQRCQQMFADLNRYAVRPSPSLGVLYDHRDSLANLTREFVFASKLFRDLVETEKSSLATRSRKLFTLSSLYTANRELVKGWEGMAFDEATEKVRTFWDELARHISEWNLVHERKLTAGEVRRDFLHSHSLFLQAMARMGHELLVQEGWKDQLAKLQSIDWSRSNPVWERRSVLNGRLRKSHRNVLLTTNVLKQTMGLPLNPAEQRAEDEFTKEKTS
jgi:DNA sulfur modification protein DndB